jgi:elongation factor Ts
MATITAKDVAELRARTGAGMMDCKKALEETSGDMEKAIENLRSKGAAKAEKRAGRSTSEGVIGSYVHHNGKIAVLVELACETDFVARTDDFQQLAKYIAEHIAAAAPIALDKDQVPQDKIDSERRVFTEQVKASGKPENMIAKIVEGKIEAYYKDVALMHQAYRASLGGFEPPGGEVEPHRIRRLDELDLFYSNPSFEHLFAKDAGDRSLMGLVVHELLDLVLCSELTEAMLVLVDAADQVVREADVHAL